MLLDLSRRVRQARTRRIFSSRCMLVLSLSLFSIAFLTFALTPSYKWPVQLQFLDVTSKRMNTTVVLPPLAERVPCFGPRNKLLSNSPDDDLHAVYLNTSYPRPFVGSYEDVGLETTWMTYDGRYGPYGYGEHTDQYKRTKVDWDSIDWGQLQSNCLARNAHRFSHASPEDNYDMSSEMRMNYRNNSAIPLVRHWNEFNSTRRTAIVLRAYSGYQYRAEDMYYIRSLIVEAGLRTGGEYKVILLVDYKNLDKRIFRSKEAYAEAVADAEIPPELRSIAVLWDEHLLANWYYKVEEYRTMWQVFQPLQLFALHYPEFDHYWQVELDMRFLGDAGQYFDAISAFARNEPRKQALERSTFQVIQDEIGDYKSLQQAVNVAALGGSYAWGPVSIPEVRPIGPKPPTEDPLEDNFEWGVGEEADVIVTSFCTDVMKANAWVFQDWIHGFSKGRNTPRFFCPPAIARSSRSLLLAIHESQFANGLRVPSEATPFSFALWNGLKTSYPPQPVFWKEENDEVTRQGWWKGGPANSTNGLGPQNATHPDGVGLSFWWGSNWPRKVMDAWVGEPDSDGVPWVLAEYEGEVYAPNALFHPVKH